MRAQVDILLAWLYFRDHPVEWKHVELTGEKYHLVSEVLKYLRTYDRRFRSGSVCFEPNGRKVKRIRTVYYLRMYTVRIARPCRRWLRLRNSSSQGIVVLSAWRYKKR